MSRPETCTGCHALYMAKWPHHCLLGYTTASRSRIVGVPAPVDPDDPVFIPHSRIDYLSTEPSEDCPGPVTESEFPSMPRRWEAEP